MWLKRVNSGLTVSVLLFLIGLPLVWQINFPQNDDWVYYRMVQNFMADNFVLDPVSAPTFYFQGLLGTLFSLVFGTERLPILTLLVSVINFYLLYKILTVSTKLGSKWSIILSLIWFFNPLNMYSSLGFMTENYLLLCALASLYFFSVYIVNVKPRHFLLFNLFLFFGLLTKQSALALAISYPAYFLVNKKWRLFGLQTLLAVLLLAFYFLVFPKTPEMYEKPLQLHHLYDFDYLKQLVTAIVIYISAFCFPLVFLALRGFGTIKNRKNLLIITACIGAALIFYLFIFKAFKPNRLGWQEFFYLDNTLERRGFYPRGVLGTKYYFKGMYDLYKYWDVTAKFFAGFVVAGLLLSSRKLKSHAHLVALFCTYLALLVLAEKVYDRYLPPLFLVFVLLMAASFNPAALTNNLRLFFSGLFLPFLAGLIFYSYQFSMDFVLVNNYIWNCSLQIVNREKVASKLIQGTNAWKLSNPNSEKSYLYDFTFDSVAANTPYGELYELTEKHRIDFPGSLFVDSDVYLYKRKNFVDVVI